MVNIKNPLEKIKGRQFEYEFFGRFTTNTHRTNAKSIHLAICFVFMGYIHGRRHPAPVTYIAHALHREVQKHLPEADKRSLHLYDALGFSLDTAFGIDGFYELKDRIVPFDLTLRPVKEGQSKRLLIIGKDDLFYPPSREKLGQVISEKLILAKPWQSLPRKRHSYLD